jgi:DNA polymerase I-like protein with 3'-5' exonuclease and polymerase domains
MWLGKEYTALQQLANGMDLYRDFASEAFNLAYGDIAKDSMERFLGKESCLSLIFGTGAEKLKNTFRLRSKGKITVPTEEAKRLQTLYRDKYTGVVDAWWQAGQALDWIYNDESHTLFDILEVHGRKGILKPSGLYLPYPNLRKEQGEKGLEYYYDVRKGRTILKEKVYPAKCFQKCTQSLARDVMAEHYINVSKEYWVAGLVHDELIAVVPDAQVEEAVARIKEIMSTSPKWAPDLPLACEVGTGKRYGDSK